MRLYTLSKRHFVLVFVVFFFCFGVSALIGVTGKISGFSSDTEFIQERQSRIPAFLHSSFVCHDVMELLIRPVAWTFMVTFDFPTQTFS